MLVRFFASLMLVILTSSVALAQAARGIPRLIQADIPNYPVIARAARVTGTVKIRVTVESGRVTKLEVLDARGASGPQVLDHGSPMLTDPTLANLRSWRFDSMVNTSIDVLYTYVLAGDPTYPTDNPKIEISPSLDVTITATPPQIME
jgi:hypothetical protein